MQWLEVSATTSNETAEAVAEVLSRYARRGVLIEAGPEGLGAGSVSVKAYLPADEELPARKRRAEEALWHLSQIQAISPPIFRSISDSDWSEAWRERLSVLHIGRHVVVCPSWLDYAPVTADVVIKLDPGMGFGTGLHPTTQMCLGALEDLLFPGTAVLDLGTGSGILAIAAAKLGGDVLAVDNDPEAVRTARENIRINNVQDAIQVKFGSLAGISASYDLIVVNILAKVIVEMLQEGLATRLGEAGKVIASGILREQEPEVVTALRKAGLALVRQQHQNDWACLIARKKTTPFAE